MVTLHSIIRLFYFITYFYLEIGSQVIEAVLELIVMLPCNGGRVSRRVLEVGVSSRRGVSGHLSQTIPRHRMPRFRYSISWFIWLCVSDICVHALWKLQLKKIPFFFGIFPHVYTQTLASISSLFSRLNINHIPQ